MMSQPAMSPEWVLATHNPGKLRELEELFSVFCVRLRTAGELGADEAPEDGQTFEENAAIKALATSKSTGRVAVADDSGVCVDVLGGAPGIHTARWAGEPRDFALARHKLHARLEALDVPKDWRASFVSVLCVATPGGTVRSYRGETRGAIVWPPRGDLDLGLEAMFLPDGYAVTYGQMEHLQRMRVNARAQAMRRLWLAYRHLASEYGHTKRM